MRDRSTWQRTAETWLRKTVYRLGVDAVHDNEYVRADACWDAGRLFNSVLDAADQLVPLLNEDDLPDARRLTRELADRLRAIVLAEKLEQVEGRTVEEAEGFLAKAADLRGR